jgi:isopenicillin N synthase-like dioxygenase
MDAIPTIDLTGLGSNPEGVVAAIRRAYTEVGFAYLVGHRIPAAMIDAAFRQSRRFHALPLEDKLALRVNDQHRGYLPFADSTIVTSSIQKATRPNRSESLMLMHEISPAGPTRVDDPFAGPNQWPALEGFREAMVAYEAAVRGVALLLVDLFELVLDLPPGTLQQHFRSPTTFLRLLHYPPQEPDGPDDEFGSNPHTDYGFMTLLAQDSSGGLQVRAPDGGIWLDVPPRAGAFVLNVGDVGARWSNDRLRSTPHRVINRTGRDRYSIPYFFDPAAGASTAPLAACLAPGDAPHYPDVTYGAYVLAKLDANHSYRSRGPTETPPAPPEAA